MEEKRLAHVQTAQVSCFPFSLPGYLKSRSVSTNIQFINTTDSFDKWRHTTYRGGILRNYSIPWVERLVFISFIPNSQSANRFIHNHTKCSFCFTQGNPANIFTQEYQITVVTAVLKATMNQIHYKSSKNQPACKKINCLYSAAHSKYTQLRK